MELIALFLLKISSMEYYHLFFQNYEDYIIYIQMTIMLLYLLILVLMLFSFHQQKGKFVQLVDKIVTKVQYCNCFYLYVLQIPFQLSCIHKLQEYNYNDDNYSFLSYHLTVFSLVLSFFMGLCIEHHNQSLLSFENKNFIQKRGQSSLHTVLYVLEQILILINDSLLTDIITQVAILLLSIIYCYFYFKNGEYINFQIQKLVTFSQLLLLYSSITQLALPSSFLYQKNLLLFIFLILLPFSMKSASIYSSLKQNIIINQFSDTNICQSIEVHQLKQMIDFLLQESELFNEEYNNGKGVILEDIMANHLIQCKQEQTCFCQNYSQETYIKQQTEQDIQNRSNYLIEYVYQVIKTINQKNNPNKKFIGSDNNTNKNDNSFNKSNKNSSYAMSFIQIYYAMQIIKNPIECVQLYYQLTRQIARDNKNMNSIFDQRVLFNIKQYLSNNFNEKLLKQQYTNQFLKIYDVIEYEKRKYLIHQKVLDCIENTITYYNYLQSNQLSYALIENYSKNILYQKKIIEEDFQFLSRFELYNKDIFFLVQIYLEAYDQENQTVQQFFQGILRNDRLLNLEWQQNQQIQQFLSPSHGAIYCSFFNEGCKISQHSQSFITLLNLANQNIVNFDIISFIPTEKQILEEVLNSSLNHTNRQQILSQKDRFGFGINEQHVIVPLNVTTKIQFLSDEVGICILVKRCSTYNNFLLLSQCNKIVGVTKSLQESLSEYQNYKNIIGAGIQDHIPYLKDFDYSSVKDILYSTIFVIDKRCKLTDASNLFQSQLNLDQYLLFDISFKIISVQFDKPNMIQYRYLEIVNFKIIKDRDEMAMKVMQFKNYIDNPSLIFNTDKGREGTMSIVETKSFIFGTKFLNEQKMYQEAECFSVVKNDPLEVQNDQKINNQNTFFQLQSQKKISFHFDNSQQNSNLQSHTQKSSNIQKVEDQTQREKSKGFLNTQNQNVNEFKSDDMILYSPRLAEGQMKDDISTMRDLKSARQILEPTQCDTQYKSPDLRHHKKSSSYKYISKTDINNSSDHEQIKHIFKNNPHSIKSKSSSLNNKSSNYQNRIYKRIKQRKMSCNLKYFIVMGIISLLQLLNINWVFYQINLDGIASFKQYFKIMSNPMIMYMKSLDFLRLISYQQLITNDNFILKEQTKSEINKILIDQEIIQNRLKSQFLDLVKYNDSQLIDFVTTEFEENLDQQKLQQNEISNLFITLKNYLTSSYLLVRDKGRKLYMWSNMITLKKKVFTFQDYIKNDMIQLLERCQKNNFITLVIVVSSSLFLTTVILFIIYVQQMQKKKMLSLLGCFTPEILAAKQDKLQEMIFQHKSNILQIKQNNSPSRTRKRMDNPLINMNYINKNKENGINKQECVKEVKKEEYNSIVKKQNYLESNITNGNLNQKASNYKEYVNQNNKRKRIQAHFDKFRALKYHHFFMAFIIICFINCQSIINIIIFNSFENEQKWLIDEKFKIYDLGSIVIQNASPQILNLESYWQKQDTRSSIYTQFIEDQKAENKEKLLLVKTLADPVNLSLHNEYEYENFYSKMLTGDICQIRENFKKYVQTNFTLDYCQNLYQSVLTKGFLISISRAYQEVDSLMDLYNNRSVTDDEILISKNIYQKYLINGHSLSELNNLLKIINESIDSILIYFHTQSDNYADFTLNLFQILFTIQIFLVLILVASILFIVNKKLKTEINQIKLYFSLFNSRILQSNSLLKQYFTKSSFQ